MISELFASEQIGRLEGLDFFPTKDAPLAELVKALQVVATNEKTAERIISEWLEEYRKAPKPADIYAIRRTMPRISSEGNDPYAEFVPEWRKGPQPC